jgi:hypothetical protein
MALRVAVASGNWSNPAIWNGGVLPNPGDIVASNNFTVTIDQNINVDSLTNTAQSLIDSIPNMTSPTSPSGIVTASSEDPSNPAWRAFNGVYDYPAWYGTGSGTQFIAYEFANPVRIDSYFLALRGDTYDPKDWTFEAWNGSSWIILDTVVNRTISANYMSPILNNPTAYIKYRLNITGYKGAGTVVIVEFDMYPYLGTTAAVAGGGFILNSGLIINVTGVGIRSGTIACVTYSATSGTTTINGNILGSTTTNNAPTINHTNAANLNINGNITSGTLGGGGLQPAINKTGAGTLTVIGTLNVGVATNGNHCIVNSGIGTINITGNLFGQSGGGSGSALSNTGLCTINITGDIYAGSTNADVSLGIINTVAASIYITGNVYSNTANPGISSSGAHYLNIVGILTVNPSFQTVTTRPAVISSSSSAINLFSGPFISSSYGFVPFQVIRMHLIPTINSYIEFRDETTNGAVSPGAIAPATRLVSPATLVDNLAPSDVRFGTSYALGTLTGTLRMPVANQVTFGVQVDNTFGNAVLTADGIWNYLVSNLNTPDSIGMRLKNVATPQTTGEQLEAFLRLD